MVRDIDPAATVHVLTHAAPYCARHLSGFVPGELTQGHDPPSLLQVPGKSRAASNSACREPRRNRRADNPRLWDGSSGDKMACSRFAGAATLQTFPRIRLGIS